MKQACRCHNDAEGVYMPVVSPDNRLYAIAMMLSGALESYDGDGAEWISADVSRFDEVSLARVTERVCQEV